MKRLLHVVLGLSILIGSSSVSQAQVQGGIPNTWTNITDADTGIVGATAFSIGGKGYVVGGDTSEYHGVFRKYSKSLYVYDSANNDWNYVNQFPGRARVGAVAFTIGNVAYYGLGQDSTGYRDTTGYRQRFLDDWWKFDPSGNTWTQLNDFPGEGRAWGNGFAFPNAGKGGILNGVGHELNANDSFETKFFGDLWIYDPGTDSWTQKADFGGGPRANGIAMVLDGDKLFAGLGDSGEFNIYLDDWWEYSLSGDSWTKREDYPAIPKIHAGHFQYGDYGFIIGGFDGVWSKRMYQYDGNADSWQQYPDYRDSGRFKGVSWMLGQLGYYGLGFRGNSEELETVSSFFIDTAAILITSDFPDTVCGSETLTVRWTTGDTFTSASNFFGVQMSDSVGLFTWPPTSRSILDSFSVTGVNNGTFTVDVPFDVLEGRKYRLRIISSDKFILGRPSDTFYVKANPRFFYDGERSPLIDTVCSNSDFFLPANASGTGNLTYQWRKDGVALTNNATFAGVNSDTLRVTSMQPGDAGKYTVLVQGDCYGFSSDTFKIAVVNIPPPTVTFQVADTVANDTVFICEYASMSLKAQGVGAHINYEWFKDGQPLADAENFVGINTNQLDYIIVHLRDTGWYKTRVYEDCGAYTYTDSFYLKVRAIPRIVQEPANIFPPKLEGSTVGFKVVATGFDLKYQWRAGNTFLSNNSKYSGVDTDSLTISNITLQDVEFYSAIITGGCPPQDTSNLAILDIDVAPLITRQPRDTAQLCENSSTSINVLVDGANLGYEWRLGQGLPGTPIASPNVSGINTRLLEFNFVQLSDAGDYFCKIDNGGIPQPFEVGSDYCVVIVNPIPGKPTITKFGPLLQSDTIGDTYLWFYNGRYQPQYKTRAINIPDTLEGDYQVRVIRKGCVSPISEPTAFYTSVLNIDKLPLEMYPNPVSEKLTIELPEAANSESTEVVVLDITGKEVMRVQGDIYNSQVNLNVTGLSKGMYVVNVRSNGQTYSGKFVKH